MSDTRLPEYTSHINLEITVFVTPFLSRAWIETARTIKIQLDFGLTSN